MNPTILAIDDDPLILDVYQTLLGDQHRLHLAASGEDALELLTSGLRPDLILLDIVMPGMTGYEVCQHLRDHALFSHLKVIFVSSKSMVDEKMWGYGVGADDYITKPFEESELLAKVTSFLRLKHVNEIHQIKKDFFTLLSHEMRTPLNGILGFSQLLRHSPNLDPDEKESVGLIIECAQDILQLSEKTLLLNDLRSGHIVLNKEKLNLSQLIFDGKCKFTERIHEKGLTVQERMDSEIEIEGDPRLLPHAIELVLDNAVKFSRRGAVVEVTVCEVGNRVRLTISNEGDAIAEEHLEDVFNVFFVQNIDKHRRGHGLSLATARRIIEAHNGTLSVKNQDQGPVFVFDIPSELPVDTAHHIENSTR